MRYDHFSMLPEKAFQPRNGRRGMTLEGGGGGGGQTSTTYTSNIPEWLRPQTEALLGAATQEYFRVDPSGQITGMKPYRPFSEDKESYLAPFSQQQQQVFGEVGQMATSPLYGQAAGLTGTTAGTALGYGQQAAGMGGLYERMATDPMSVQSYMSPYMQQVVERQKVAAIEDAQRANLGQNLAAVRQGTYGGARQALAQSQREAALEKQLGDIQASGLQSAFEQAQKAQQFGAGLGLQGLGTGLQGLSTAGQMGAQLGNIATAQQQADIQRLGIQREIGGEQQARQQAIINQAIQDYALAEQYPYQQLAGYSGLLRGYATPTTTISQYQAAQSPMTQLAGLGTTAVGIGQLAGVGGKKAGGQIKSYAEGGITSVDALEGMAEDLSIPQLQQSIQNKTLPEYVGIPILQNKVNNAERMQMAQAGIAPDMGGEPPIADQVMARADAVQGQGIDSVQRAAGGGMVAFDKGGIARFQNQGIVLGEPEITQEMLEEERRRQQMFLGVDPRIAKTKEALAKQGEEGFMDRALRGLQMIGAGEKIRTKGDFSELEKVNQAEMARRKAMAERQMKLAELEGADYQQRAGIYKDVTGREREKARIAAEQKFKAGESEKDRQNRLAVASLPPDVVRGARAIMMPGEKLEDALSRFANITSTKDQYNAAAGLVKSAYDAASKRFADSIGGSGGNFALAQAAGGIKEAQKKLGMTKEQAEKELLRIRGEYLKEAYSDIGMSPEVANQYLRAPRGSGAKSSDAPKPAPAAPPQDAINALKNDNTPLRRKQFDEVFGPGAADRVLPPAKAQ